MKLFKFNVVLLLLLLVVACSPIRYIGIETYNPAGITFPKEVKKILVVNHAVPQPEVPFESTLVAARKDTVKIAADSALFEFCRTLALKIAASPYFEDVRLLDEGYRADNYFFSDRMLTESDVSVLCREHEVDAIISLDRLLFQINESVQKAVEFEFAGWMEIEVSGTLRAYLPGRSEPLSSLLIVDTVYSQLQLDGLHVVSALVNAEEVLQEAAKLIAERSLVNFIPYWSDDARWYYVSSNAQWKVAAAYAASDKWLQAFDTWKVIYDGMNDASWKPKARLASNLALSNELTGDFSKALYWASDSFRLLQGKVSESDPFFKLQEMYVEVLKYRMLADKRLHLQIDE